MNDIIKNIDILDSSEKLHILNMLKSSNIQYTKNSNGYFFNAEDIHQNTNVFEKLRNCVSLIISNRDLIKEMDRKRDDVIKEYRRVIETKISRKNTKHKLNKEDLVLKKHNINIDITCSYNTKTTVEKHLDPDLLISIYNDNITKKLKSNRLYHKMKKSSQNVRNIAKETYFKTDENVLDSHTYGDNDVTSKDLDCDDEVDGVGGGGEDIEGEGDIEGECDIEGDEDIQHEHEHDGDCDDDGEDNYSNVGKDSDTHSINGAFLFDIDGDGTSGSDNLYSNYADINHKMSFYRSILFKLNYKFVTGNHDILVFQEFI
jgi:hypothetical protein